MCRVSKIHVCIYVLVLLGMCENWACRGWCLIYRSRSVHACMPWLP